MRDLSKQKRFKWAAGVRYWLAHDGNEAAAFLASWPGGNGVGQIEDLFTHPKHRHRGLATALIAHCVADARGRGAGPVVIIADPSETPAQCMPLWVSGPSSSPAASIASLEGRAARLAEGPLSIRCL